MKVFDLRTRIGKCDTFADFAKEYSLDANDLVVTQSFLYEPFMKNLGLPCRFVMQDKYGSGEPSDEMMNAILKDVKDFACKRIIAIGGGTVIDISKVFALKGIDNVTDAFERKIPIVKDKALLIVPTTCGTGSEVTNISIAEIRSKHTKMGLADDAIIADDAVLIPELLKGLPFKFYAFSAIDALIHATESYVSPKASAYTRLFSREAIHIILDVFNGIVKNGEEYRMQRFDDMLVAANFAGIAFGNAGVGAVHAMSYPLGANYHVPHGEANYQFFTEVFRFYNKRNPDGCIKELNALLAKELQLPEDASYETIYTKLAELLDHLVSKRPLHEFGMKEPETDSFAHSVIETQQRLLKNNYVPMSVEEIKNIYSLLF
jgi:4-hydroxybutyrate dehydrogenase